MPAGRAKFNFYAVTNGRETGVYTNWPQAGDSVLGYANAKYKGFATYNEAADAMINSGYSEFSVFDGRNTYAKSEYEQCRLKQGEQLTSDFLVTPGCSADQDNADTEKLYNGEIGEFYSLPENQKLPQQSTAHTVYIDGSCVRNGMTSAKAGIGLFWGDNHPLNCSISLTADATLTNNKAELRAAIKAIELASENEFKELIINSDSKYVINGVTEWIQKWMDNGWKASSGEQVKNREEWIELMNIIESSKINIIWKHVSAHSGIAGNEEADKLAQQAAKRETANIQMQGSKSASLNEKAVSSNTHPQVIVIPRKINDNCISPKKLTVINIPTTPARKPTRDRSETPVPGAINGSRTMGQEKANFKQNDDNQQNRSKQTTVDHEQTVKTMNNIEATLQNVMFEIHQLREHQVEFKSEITEQLNKLHIKQRDMENSISTISQDISSDVKRYHAKIRDLEELGRQEKLSDSSNAAIVQHIASLQKNVDARNDNMNISILSVESTVSDLKIGVDKMSQDCQAEFQSLKSKNNQLQESMTDVNKDIKATKGVMSEMEKSLTILANNEKFTKPAKTAKPNISSLESSPSPTSNVFEGLINEEDEERTLRNHESNEQNPIIITEEAHEQSEINEVGDVLRGEARLHGKMSTTHNKGPSVNGLSNENQCNDVYRVESSQSINKDREIRSTESRRDKIYLIGDSISGQINPVVLGKSTKTFVRKLRAPKIQDINKTTDQVKDAKLIIIHAGINNIRDKTSNDDEVSNMVKAIELIKEAAPKSEVVVSKLIPIGDRTLNIERSIFNASVEKKITEDGKLNVQFLDHGNLAERGQAIKSYYTDDFIHLAPEGIDVLTTNLRSIIMQILKKNASHDQLYHKNIFERREDSTYRNRGPLHKDRSTADSYRRQRVNSSSYKYSINRGDYEGMGHHNTYPSNRDDYPPRKRSYGDDRYRRVYHTIADERNSDDRYNRLRYRIINKSDYDNDSYSQDNSFPSERYDEHEERYGRNRHYDRFADEYYYSRF